MSGNSERPLLQSLLNATYFVAITFAPVAVWLLRLSPTDAAQLKPIIGYLAELMKEHDWLPIAFPVIAGVSKFSLEKLQARWVKQVIHTLLDRYRDQVFAGHQGAQHHHRVTLFKYQKFALLGTLPWRRNRWPWSGWLVPKVRSGHNTQAVKSRFLVPDSADRSEGVAGKAWSAAGVVSVEKLPALSRQSLPPEVHEYCTKTNVSDLWVRRRLQQEEKLPRSIRGFFLEVRGRPWGVVVLDSREPEGFRNDPTGSGQNTLIFLSTLSAFLERAKL